MKKGIFKLSLKATAIFFLLGNMLFAQSTPTNHKLDEEELEHLLAYWNIEKQEVKKKLGISNIDFKAFNNFYRKNNETLHAKFLQGIRRGKIDESNVMKFTAYLESQDLLLYKKFEQVKKDYPNTVAEYSNEYKRKPQSTCNPGCNNVDFSNGTLSGWNAYYAENTSSATSLIITTPVGGPAGAVTESANDPLTAASTSSSDYQVAIMTGGNDLLAPTIPKVYPFGGTKYSARVGDSTNPFQGVAILNQSFMVTTANSTLTYEFAVFLENPPNTHTLTEQPFFNVEVLDSIGDTISHCQTYNVISSNAAAQGYDSVYYATDGDYVYYKNWQVVFTDLKKYIGQCVTLQFESSDCALGGHFGYAYVSATCTPVSIITSSPNLCGQKHITLTAPVGAAQYLWSGGPANGIIGSDTTQSINIDSAGTYSVILIPYYGKSCADTLSITINKVLGTPPIPLFTADTACAGSVTQFTNLSTPPAGAGVSFYWSFYDNGVINDSTTSPNWAYTQPGTYSVVLDEISNGCGNDTVIQIKVDSIPVAAFKASNTCEGQAVTFTNQSTGATSYSWTFDNGSTSSAISPTTTYTVAGTYTVSLVAIDAGKCRDSISETIKINAVPVISITSSVKNDTLCPGSSIKLTASGAGNYTWQPGGHFGKSITVTPATTTTYTVSGSSGGGCTGEDSVTVVVLPVPNLVITANPSDTICQGTSTTLNITGGSTYTWGPATGLTPTTGPTVTASPTTTVTYTVTSGASTNGCSAKDSVTVTVFGSGALAPKVTLSRDSLCPGTSILLTASGGSTFSWGNGATTSSITVAPIGVGDTTVSVTIGSKCRADTTISAVILVESVPKPVITGNDSICPGTSTTLTASPVLGSTTSVGYLWTGTTDRTDTLTVAPKFQTTYTVISADGGCTHDTTFTVSIRPLPTVKATAIPDTICSGSTVTLNGLGGATTYSWSPATTPDPGATVTASPTVTTVYTVTGTNICSATAKVKVTVISTSIPSDTIALSRDSLCPGQLVTLSVPYTAGDNYTWSPSGGTVNPPGTSYIIAPATVPLTGYTLTISNKCASGRDSTQVYVEPRPIPVITASSASICPGKSTTLTVAPAPGSPGSPGYYWFNSVPVGNRTNSITVSPAGTTTYTVEAADGNCNVDTTITITVNPTPIVTMTTDSACKGDSVTVTATGGGTYLWFNGQTGSSDKFIVNNDMYALLTVTGSDGCPAKDSVFVTLKTPPSVWAYYDTTINIGGVATIGVTGGSSWVWEPSATVANADAQVTTATPTVTTTYTVVVTGANGCLSEGRVTVDIACHELVVPNVFTPDLAVSATQYTNDNIFYIQGATSQQSYKIEIFNRWGAPVYSSTNPSQSWDGKDKSGTAVSSGVYYYVISATCDDKSYNTHGYVQVIRNK